MSFDLERFLSQLPSSGLAIDDETRESSMFRGEDYIIDNRSWQYDVSFYGTHRINNLGGETTYNNFASNNSSRPILPS